MKRKVRVIDGPFTETKELLGGGHVPHFFASACANAVRAFIVYPTALAPYFPLMATQNDVRKIALALPHVVESKGHFAFEVPNKGKLKGFVWVWKERIDPKKARVPQPKVVAIRTANLFDKDFLIAADPEKFFIEPHYNGFPAVLVRLAAITPRELKPLIWEAWRSRAPKDLLERYPEPPRSAKSSRKGSSPRKTARKPRKT